MNLAKCNCGKKAVWDYVPGFSGDNTNDYVCDDCVSRGCSCNHTTEDYDEIPDETQIEGVDFKWVDKEKTTWTLLDEKFREYPCIEYDYEEEGYDLDETFEDEDLDS